MPVIYTDLKDKVVLISGIGQAKQSQDSSIWGNGAATAKVLTQSGAKIFGCDHDLGSAEATKRRVLEEVPNAVVDVVKTDVTKREEVVQMVKACLDKHGRIDVLVCNVGKSAPGGPVDMSEEVWQNQIDVNLSSAFHCCHSVLPIMEKQGSGSIVVLSSVAGMGYAGRMHIGYATTKAALLNFARSLGAHYAPHGIRVNAVTPGLIHTPLVARLAQEYNDGDYAGLVAKRGAAVPMKKMGSAFDVAQAIAYLSSEEAAGYVTGSNIVVDGGLSAVIHS